MTEDPRTTEGPLAAGAVSGHLDTRTAATEVAFELHDGIGASCDLALVFASFHHRAALPEAIDTIRQTVNPGTILAVTCESVLGSDHELEGLAGMSAIALRLPGVELRPWMGTPEDPIPVEGPGEIRERLGIGHEFRAAIMLADPFTTPINRLLPALASCGGPGRATRIVGGMASGASSPGQNLLVLDDRVLPAGAIGVSIAGDVEIDTVVSQGCRPIGRTFVVTRATGNVIHELGGHAALGALRDMATALDEHDRALLGKGLLIGNVIDEHKRHVGRGDFLVRNVLGVDQDANTITVGDLPRVGQTVQFHVRDAVTAGEDLQLLLDAQVMRTPPLAGLLFTCNGRGKRLFGGADHDLGVIHDRLGAFPIAGFFAAGEIGPVGDQAFLHGHTASLAIIRAPLARGAS